MIKTNCLPWQGKERIPLSKYVIPDIILLINFIVDRRLQEMKKVNVSDEEDEDEEYNSEYVIYFVLPCHNWHLFFRRDITAFKKTLGLKDTSPRNKEIHVFKENLQSTR